MAPETQPPLILRFGVFEADLRAGELRKQGKRIKIQEQPLHVLTVLLQRPGEVVTREELRNHNWSPDTFVDFDNSLNTAINKLREALGDSADNPRFIETLPRRGYRFIAPVSSVQTKKSPVLTKRGLVLAGVAVIVLVAAIGGAVILRSRQARRLTAKDTIVLADFTNTTGDPVFDEALKQGLRVQLEQSPFLNILSDQRVGKELQLMGRAKDERLTQDIAREVCERAGSKVFLAGSISSLGTHYVVGLNALTCQTGDVLGSTQMEADNREHVLKALSVSATKMRDKLGESLATIQKYDAPVEATTQSLEALRAYSLGMKTWFAKGHALSLPFFQRAAELDPRFAMAYARMAMVYNNLGERAVAAANMQKAYELREHASEWEQLYLKAHYYDRVTRELDKALDVYTVWKQTYPRDWVPYNNLNAIYSMLGNHEKALDEALEAVQLDPDNEDNYAALGETYIALKRLDDAAAVFKLADERKLEGEGLLGGRLLLAWLKDDTKEIDRLLSSAASNLAPEETVLEWKGFTAGDYGKLTQARSLWQRAAAAAEHSKASERLALLQSNTALLEAYSGDIQQARLHANTAARLAANRDTLIRAARVLALAGDVRGTEKLLTELNQRFPLDTVVQRYWIPTIRSAMVLHRKNAQEALEELSAVSPYEMGLLGHMEAVWLRGQAYLMLRNGDAAVTEFQKILDHRGIVMLDPVGVLAHIGLGRAYALQGDTAKARAAYQDFLTLWKDADPDIPILKEAKAEYARLQ